MSGDPLTPSGMVLVRTVGSPFHARVIAARLGADGIVTELRGNLGDGPYPFGVASIWVRAGDAERAGELLLADEVEAALAPAGDDPPPAPSAAVWTARRLMAAGGLLLILFAALVARVSA